MKLKNFLKAIFLIMLIGILSFSLNGCLKKETAAPIDPPPTSEGTVEINGGNEKLVAGETVLTGYFQDEFGYIVPIAQKIPKTESVAKTILELMVKDNTLSQLPSGFQGVIPAGTKILGVNIKDKLATVDFSKEFLNYAKEDETKILSAITWALTEFPTVESVQLWINGTPLTTMPQNGTPLDHPLTRDFGINLELAENIKMGNTTPVTLYFIGQAADFNYLVPVTRLVPLTNNLAQTTIEQLIVGPKMGSNLLATILPTTKLLNIEEQNEQLVANFNEDLLRMSDPVMLKQIFNSLVFSLTENTGAKQVQIMVDGNVSKITDQEFAKPVMRPKVINSISN